MIQTPYVKAVQPAQNPICYHILNLLISVLPPTHQEDRPPVSLYVTHLLGVLPPQSSQTTQAEKGKNFMSDIILTIRLYNQPKSI